MPFAKAARFRHARPLALLVAVVCVGSACGGTSVGPSFVPTGVWGGDHITMTIADTSTHIELDCAHGDLPCPLNVDARNQFDVMGTFVREHGGPIRQGEMPDSHPAMYAGSVASKRMTLTIRQTDANEVIGTFTLVRGTPGRVVKCL